MGVLLSLQIRETAARDPGACDGTGEFRHDSSPSLGWA
jgi:hypothetical protein